MILGVLAFTTVHQARAEQIESENDEYSFSWLDPDKKIYVLQNRKYTKSGRLMLSALAGTGLSNPYRTEWAFSPRATYFASEAFGVEVFYVATSNSENGTYQALTQASPTPYPVVREITSQFGVLGMWAPWYAKINVFNLIMYFDWYFSAGFGNIGYDLETKTDKNAQPVVTTESKGALYLGTGHIYHITRQLFVRLDFLGSFYRAKRFGTFGEDETYSSYNFGLGFGVKF